MFFTIKLSQRSVRLSFNPSYIKRSSSVWLIFLVFCLFKQLNNVNKLNKRYFLGFFDVSDRRYIAWLTVVAVAYNYNVWFCPARVAFPCHGRTSNPFWIFFDIVSDVVNVVDIVIWQPRLQFVKGGDIIVSRQQPTLRLLLLTLQQLSAESLCLFPTERPSSD